MFLYYLDLARRSLRRDPLLTLLMIFAIAFGIGSSMTALTVLRAVSADPIPGKSARLYHVQLDARPASRRSQVRDPANQLTRSDAEALVRAGRAARQALMVSGAAAIDPRRPGISPFYIDGAQVSSEFFALFDLDFIAGAGWTKADDDAASRVAVVSDTLAERVFGRRDVVGQALRVQGVELRILGVIRAWNPKPRFHDLTAGAYDITQDLFTPFSTSRALRLSRTGNMNCWHEAADMEALGAPCEWVEVWVELRDATEVAVYQEFLMRYSEDQLAAGRFEVAPNVRLRNVRAWLADNEVVPSDVKLQTWIALGFLIVCLVNTVGLLLTKFLRRSVEIGVRRALGASKRTIFSQLLIEAGMLGAAGGLLGVVLAWLGLWMVRHQPTDYAALSRLDLPMLLATFSLAVLSSLLAGLLPAWRGCQVTPALQLKSL
jgi:putative ABC transport system permease protein